MSEETTADPAPLSLAPHHLRLFAAIIDYLVAITIIKVTEQIALGADWDLIPPQPEAFPVTAMWVASLVGLLAAKDIFGGRSLGKWLTGIAVREFLDADRTPPVSRLLLRNVSLLIAPIDCVLIFVDPACRRIGERLAGTVVIVPPNIPPVTRRLLLVTTFLMAQMLITLVIVPWNMRRSAAYKTAMEIARQHPRVLQAVGAQPEFNDDPELALDLTPEGGNATVTFSADRDDTEWTFILSLNLDRSRNRWMLQSLEAELTSERIKSDTIEQMRAPNR